MITFEDLRAANLLRERAAKKYKACAGWKLSDWTNAMAGEAGEACNVTKKMSLMWPACEYPLTEEQLKDDLTEALGKEIADVVIYADLLASKIGKTLPELVLAKFNEVSTRIGSEVFLQGH